MGDHLELKHRYVLANGTNIHIAEQGSGPVVILLHGFPEIWYSWRHQLKGLAAAGFHAVAPDLRGFGLTENPHGADSLYFLDVIADVVGLILALGQKKVYVVGHDIGAAIGWYLTAFRPDLVKGYASLGVPYFKPRLTSGLSLPPSEGLYVSRFQQPGRADADFGRFDTKTVFCNIYKLFCLSETRIASPEQEIMDLMQPWEQLPAFLSEEDVKVYVEHYEKSGFSVPVRLTYVNIRRNLELISPYVGYLVQTPALLVVGENDYVTKFPGFTCDLEELRKDVPNLEPVETVPGGHFFQEQVPEQVNEILVRFLQKLEAQT